MGMNFRYSYNWYIHGPYSPELADDAYEIEGNKQYYDSEIERYSYKQKALHIIEAFNDLFGDKRSDSEWLELVSSLLFLKKHYNLDSQELASTLLKRKPKFISRKPLVYDAIRFTKKVHKVSGKA